MRWSHIDIAVAACLACAVAFIASCRSPGATRVVERVEPPRVVAGRPGATRVVERVEPPRVAAGRPAPPYLTGGRITALREGALVADADTGMLTRIGESL